MTKKANLFNRETPNMANLLRKKSVRIRKGKRVVKPSKQMEIVNHQATGIQFQDDIIMEILSRLPVQSLLQLKCVSNSWQALISDPYFKLKHLTKNNQKLLVCESWLENVDMERTFKISFYSFPLSNVQELNCLSKYVQELDCPSTFKPLECQLFCSFNGLAVLGFYSTSDQQLFLWNPSTRESTLLPHSEFTHMWTMFGLGYDATSDEYNLLKWTMLKGGQSIEILSLKSGTWRNIWYYPTTIAIFPRWGEKLPIYPYQNDNWCIDTMVFVHGAFHWLGTTISRTYHLVSFSFSDEVYGEIPLLEQMHISNEDVLPNYGLSLVEGMLCVSSTDKHQGWGTFKLWVMKDYGVKESWTLLFTIRLSNIVYAKFKHRFANGEVLLYLFETLANAPWTNRMVTFGHTALRTSTGPVGFWPEYFRVHDGIAYTESLISPKSLI